MQADFIGKLYVTTRTTLCQRGLKEPWMKLPGNRLVQILSLSVENGSVNLLRVRVLVPELGIVSFPILRDGGLDRYFRVV